TSPGSFVCRKTGVSAGRLDRANLADPGGVQAHLRGAGGRGGDVDGDVARDEEAARLIDPDGGVDVAGRPGERGRQQGVGGEPGEAAGAGVLGGGAAVDLLVTRLGEGGRAGLGQVEVEQVGEA